MRVAVTKLRPDAILPVYQKPGDSGFDLHCLDEVTIPPFGTALLHTGLAFAVPQGFEMQIRLRSGIALHTPLVIPNAPGTVDAGYRGEVLIITRNTGQVPWTVHRGERIAQGVICPVVAAEFAETDSLPESARGSAGFGSTGTGLGDECLRDS